MVKGERHPPAVGMAIALMGAALIVQHEPIAG